MTKIEYELRVLDIDPRDIKSKLKKLNARHIAERRYRRHVFETIPSTKGVWVRLRTDGETTTLAVKQISTDKVDGTKEWETKVDDFDTVLDMLHKIGLRSKGYQENNRSEYELEGAQVCIDTWPKIPAYLEIEAQDVPTIEECAKKLGFKKSELTGMNNEKIYKKYGIDISIEADLSF